MGRGGGETLRADLVARVEAGPSSPTLPEIDLDLRRLYHVSRSANRDSIQEKGLLLPEPGRRMFTEAGEWAVEYYGRQPIYLSLEPGRSADTVYTYNSSELFDAWQIDTDGLELVADLPGLYDSGARVDDDGMWWEEGYEPEPLQPFLEPDSGWISIEDLLGIAARAAIATTKTAACLEPIGPERLKLVRPGG